MLFEGVRRGAPIGVLAAIVVVRTFLSFSIELETEGRWPWQASPDARSPLRLRSPRRSADPDPDPGDRSVIPALHGLEGHHRISAHRPLYHAALLAQAGRARPRGPRWFGPVAADRGPPAPLSAALLLVDAADMRYADIVDPADR
jgi:hypothetical protein